MYKFIFIFLFIILIICVNDGYSKKQVGGTLTKNQKIGIGIGIVLFLLFLIFIFWPKKTTPIPTPTPPVEELYCERIDINPCIHGTCISIDKDNYRCECDNMYEGDNCDILIGIPYPDRDKPSHPSHPCRT